MVITRPPLAAGRRGSALTLECDLCRLADCEKMH